MSLARLKSGLDDRAKVNAWLDNISETDAACRFEVLEQCRTDAGARSYYVNRYESECAA